MSVKPDGGVLPSDALAAYLRDKRILVLGFGREGKSTYSFLKNKLPGKRFAVADANKIDLDDPDVTLLCGESYLDGLGDHDLVIKTPGIAFLNGEGRRGAEISCQADLFLRFCRCPVLGVTGSKGKTTTTTLAYKMLAASGADATLCGNMGIPVLDMIDLPASAVAVMEMSSHQLEFCTASPDVAVITNIYEEHLDHYETGFDGYVGAKANITAHQDESGRFFYDADSAVKDFPAFFKGRGRGEAVSGDTLPSSIAESLASNRSLIGEKAKTDAALAFRAASLLGADEAGAAEAVREFKAIEHRLEFFGNHGGIDWYDDAIATIPAAGEIAVRSVPNAATLIFGGLDRGIDYTEYIDFLASCALETLIGMPDTGYAIIDELQKRGCKKRLIKAPDLGTAVDAAYAHTREGKAVVLSPAAASYNAFKNFEHKGNEFKRIVASAKPTQL